MERMEIYAEAATRALYRWKPLVHWAFRPQRSRPVQWLALRVVLIARGVEVGLLVVREGLGLPPPRLPASLGR